MIHPIYLYGSEVLRRKASEVTPEDAQRVKEVVSDLWETLGKSDGCGLAAPQIGISLRILVVDGDVMTDVYDYLKGFKRVMVNPVVLEESHAQCEFNEGCLSVPGIYADVRRPESITVRYLDENLQEHTETLDGFGCRMVQHEMSHLDGVLFTDLVVPIRRKMLSGKLSSIARGKVSTHYKSVIK